MTAAITQESSPRPQASAAPAKPLRVLMISGDFPPVPGGGADYSYLLAQSLYEAGADVTVLTSAPDGDPSPVEYDFAVHREFEDWRLKQLGRLLDWVRANGPWDVVHIQYSGIKYGRGLAINLLPRKLRKSKEVGCVVLTVHDYRIMRCRWRARVVPMLMGSDGVNFPDPPDGPPMGRWAKFGGGKLLNLPIVSNILPVPLPADEADAVRGRHGLTGAEAVIITFGLIVPYKDLNGLIEAVRSLRTSGRDARLLVLGATNDPEMYQREFKPAFDQATSEGWFSWAGNTDADEVSRCLQVSDIACFPFDYGATANRGSMLAALLHDVPTVSTEGEATPANFADEYGVLCVAPRSAEALREGLERLLTSSEAREELRDRARTKAQELTWAHTAKQTLEFYRQILSSRGRLQSSPR